MSTASVVSMGTGADTSRTSADGLPLSRKPTHLRRITVEGFERSDGLVDIEGTLIDTKPYELALHERTLAAGAAIHHMTLRLAIDAQFAIVEAEARTWAAPHGVCGEIGPSYKRLVGLVIGPGFNLAVKRMFQKTLGCTHLTELLPAMATTAYQIAWAPRGSFGTTGGASPIGGCHALRIDGPIARRDYPEAVARAEARRAGAPEPAAS